MKFLLVLSFLISSKRTSCNSISNCCDTLFNLSQIIDLIHSNAVYTSIKKEMNTSLCDKSELTLYKSSSISFETSRNKNYQKLTMKSSNLCFFFQVYCSLITFEQDVFEMSSHLRNKTRAKVNRTQSDILSKLKRYQEITTFYYINENFFLNKKIKQSF